jgi:HK97 family phage portal protein
MENLTELIEHPLLDLFDDVNGWSEGYSFMESLFSDLDIFGRFFVQKVYSDANGPPTELWRMQPQLMKVIPHPSDFVSHYEYGQAPRPKRLDIEDVWWLKLNDPDDPWGGLGPLEAWLRTIDADHAMAVMQQDQMERGGTPDLIIKNSKGWGDTQKKRAFRSEFRSLFGRLSRRREHAALVDGDVQIDKLNQTNRELEFTQSEISKRDQVCAALDVPVSFVMSDRVAANSREAMNQFKLIGIWPRLQRMQDSINQRLIPEWSDQLLAVFDNPLQEDRQLRILERDSKLRSGYSINEVRADDGDASIDNPQADMPLVADGVTPIEFALREPPPMPTGFGGFGRFGVSPGQDAQEDNETTGEQDTDEEKAVGFTSSQVVEIVRAIVPQHNPNITTADLSVAGYARDTQTETKPLVESHTDMLFGVFMKQDTTQNPDPNFSGGRDAANADGFASALMRTIGAFIEAIEKRIIELGGNTNAILTMAIDDIMDGEAEWPDELGEIARLYLPQAVQGGGEAAALEIGAGLSFDFESRHAQEYVETASRRIGGNVSETLSTAIRSELIAALDLGENIAQIAARIQNISAQAKWRTERIARTETAFAHTAGSLESWRQSGVVEGKKFLLAPGACSLCRTVAAKYGDGTNGESDITLSLNQPLFQVGDTLRVEGRAPVRFDYVDLQGPPIHPNCRCSMLAVLKEI